MKFVCTTTINLPRTRVVELFKNPDNLKHWQGGFESITPISGTPGVVGSKSKLIFTFSGKPME